MTASNNLKILAIPYFFAPAGWPRSIRWTNICRFLAESGHFVTVIAAVFPDHCEWIDKSLNSIAEHSNVDIRYLPISECLPGARANIKWAWNAFKLAKQLPILTYDLLLSSALPIWSHVVATALMAKNKSRIWIADYGDPWSFSPLRNKLRFRSQIELSFERQILKRADAVSITTPQAKEIFAKVFPHRDRIFIIPQGASLYHLRTNWNPPNRAQNTLQLLYTGGLHKIRNPAALFQALARVETAILTIVGSHEFDIRDMARRFSVEERLVLHTYSELSQIVRLQKETDVLVLIANTEAVHIPGKVYEYLATNKPILYITEVENDQISNLIHEQNAGYVCQNNPGEIEEMLLNISEAYYSSQLLARHPLKDVGFDQRAEEFINIYHHLKTS